MSGEEAVATLELRDLQSKLVASDTTIRELKAAGEALYTLVDFVKSNITLDDNGAEHWFDDRDAALAQWAAINHPSSPAITEP